MMPRNKPRLQLALYARPKHPGSYHYALFVSPKSTTQKKARTATKHHVKNTLQITDGQVAQPWRYERISIPDVNLEPCLLVRVVIGKVTSIDALETILEALPVYQVDDADQEKARAFDCQTWVRTALEQLEEQGVWAGSGDWDSIRKRSVEYVESQHELGR
jgi:hypothetical protein